MTEEKVVDPNITSEDKTWALLAWIFSPLVPIILLFIEDKKNRPFLKAHYPQSLAFVIVAWLISGLLTPVVGIGCVTWIAAMVFQIIWGIKAYNGGYVQIPFLTDFIKKQGWA